MIRLAEHIEDLAARPDVHVLVLAAEGTEFCRGRDGRGESRVGMSPYEVRAHLLSGLLSVFDAIAKAPIPLVSCVQGPAPLVPRPAGGVTDVIARHLAERAGPRVGNMVVLNLGGAAGAIGTATAAKAQPDGKTLLLGGTSDVVINPLIADRVTEIRTLMPVAILANTITGILINPIIPAKSLPELVAYKHPTSFHFNAVEPRQLLLEEPFIGGAGRHHHAQPIIARAGHQVAFEHLGPTRDRLGEAVERFLPLRSSLIETNTLTGRPTACGRARRRSAR